MVGGFCVGNRRAHGEAVGAGGVEGKEGEDAVEEEECAVSGVNGMTGLGGRSNLGLGREGNGSERREGWGKSLGGGGVGVERE